MVFLGSLACGKTPTRSVYGVCGAARRLVHSNGCDMQKESWIKNAKARVYFFSWSHFIINRYKWLYFLFSMVRRVRWSSLSLCILDSRYHTVWCPPTRVGSHGSITYAAFDMFSDHGYCPLLFFSSWVTICAFLFHCQYSFPACWTVVIEGIAHVYVSFFMLLSAHVVFFLSV